MGPCKHGHVDGVMHRPCPKCANEYDQERIAVSNIGKSHTAPTPEPTRKIVCHAPGDRCFGCAHYQGKSPVCEHAYAPVEPALQGTYTDLGRIDSAPLVKPVAPEQSEVERLRPDSGPHWGKPND